MTTTSATKPSAFIFDCDGTLLDSMGVWLTTQPRLLASYGISTTSDDFARFESLSVEDECRAYHEVWGVGESGESVYRDLMALLAIEYSENIEARPGVVDFLSEAHEAGIPMAIATSTPVSLVEKGLAHTGLAEFFPLIVTTGEAGRSKEHPDVYNLALERLCSHVGIPVPDHGSVWVFEDAPFGLTSTRDAGYRRVGIYDPAGRGAREDVRSLSDIFIDSFAELSLSDIESYRGEA